jgi:hypothetical protein
VFSVLNTSLYLGAFVLASGKFSAASAACPTATNPLFINTLDIFHIGLRYSKRPLTNCIEERQASAFYEVLARLPWRQWRRLTAYSRLNRQNSTTQTQPA